MIKPRGSRVLVKMIDAINDLDNKLCLTLVDKKKHFAHVTRRGTVQAVGPDVRLVSAGDVVVIRGDAGFTLDGDPEVERPEYGENYRWLKEEECLAVEEVAA